MTLRCLRRKSHLWAMNPDPPLPQEHPWKCRRPCRELTLHMWLPCLLLPDQVVTAMTHRSMHTQHTTVCPAASLGHVTFRMQCHFRSWYAHMGCRVHCLHIDHLTFAANSCMFLLHTLMWVHCLYVKQKKPLPESRGTVVDNVVVYPARSPARSPARRP